MPALRRLALTAAFLLSAAAVHAESLHLVAPSDGATLRGGRFATLSWTPGRLVANAEEWEAFLSVDGGRFYAVRLTPHLDIAVRTFEVLIPNVDSDDVRILLRTGDERNETIIPMPQRFRIRAEAAPVQPARTRGEGPESARPGEPLVVQWSAGGNVFASTPPAQISSAPIARCPSKQIALTAHRVRAGFSRPDRLRTCGAACPPAIARSRDLLLLASRMNV